jgi:hypothetical protein
MTAADSNGLMFWREIGSEKCYSNVTAETKIDDELPINERRNARRQS